MQSQRGSRGSGIGGCPLGLPVGAPGFKPAARVGRADRSRLDCVSRLREVRSIDEDRPCQSDRPNCRRDPPASR